ncbi:unnamed protein product [Brassica rapa subsp. trilocularis]
MFLTEIYLFCYTLEIVDQNEPKLYLQWHTMYGKKLTGNALGVNKNWYGGLFCGAGSGCGGGGVIDVDMIFVKTDDFKTDYFARRYFTIGCRQICCKFLMLVVAFHNNLNSKYLLESQIHHQPI